MSTTVSDNEKEVKTLKADEATNAGDIKTL
jgi:hypothetical protein